MTAERPLKPSGIVRALARSAQYAEPFMVTLAIIGIVGNPLFYLVWTLLIPQPFEDLGIRLAISALCVPIAFHKRWPSALRRWLPLYWHAALLITVPFQFSLFMFLNQYSLPWVLTVMAGSFLITFFMHWALAVGQYVAGTTLAYGVFLMTGWQDESIKIPLEIFVVYLFTLFVGSAVNLRLQRSREAEAAMGRRLRTLAGQNAALMRERNELLGHFLNNTVIERLRSFEDRYGLEEALARMTQHERRFCALMQADIRSFSKMFDGDNELQVAQLIAQCYSEITSIGQDLAVLKPVGDCIFLYSDIEQSREEAVLNVFSLACVFVQSVERVNENAQALHASPMNFGIALHAGEVVYGNLASETLIDPTVMGLNVNLTARLEELTKVQSVQDQLGPNGLLLSEEFVWLLRKAGVSLPGAQLLDLAVLGASVRDFPQLSRLYGLPRPSVLEFAASARERIRVARVSRIPRLLHAEHSRHREVEYYYEMSGSGPNLVWSIFVDVSRWPTQRVDELLRTRFQHLKATMSGDNERWLALSTENEPGSYDETDVEAWVMELIDHLVGPEVAAAAATPNAPRAWSDSRF